MTKKIDWQTIILDQAFMGKLRNFANKRFGDTVFAEEAYTVAFDSLVDPAWQATRLQRFKGTSSPQGFLFSAYRNLLEDYSRKKFGRPRTPKWVERLGPLWAKIYKLLCIERLVPDAIFSRLQTELTEELKDVAAEAIVAIRSRVHDCGKKSGEVPHDFSDSEDSGKLGRSEASSSEETLDNNTLHEILSALKAVFLQNTGSGQVEMSPQVLAAISSFSLDLNPDEKLLLRMVYQDGKSVSAAARLLDMPAHTVRRAVKDSVASLRQQLEKCGVGSNMIHELFS